MDDGSSNRGQGMVAVELRDAGEERDAGGKRDAGEEREIGTGVGCGSFNARAWRCQKEIGVLGFAVAVEGQGFRGWGRDDAAPVLGAAREERGGWKDNGERSERWGSGCRDPPWWKRVECSGARAARFAVQRKGIRVLGDEGAAAVVGWCLLWRWGG